MKMKIKLKKLKGITLVELMTGMAIYGIFLLMMTGTFYGLINFGNKSQKVLVARERGQRVIAYIDSRIRRAGLGLHALTSSEEVRNALKPLTESNKRLLGYDNGKLKLPVALAYSDNDDPTSDVKKMVADTNKTFENSDGHTILYGNILTLLYAEREDDTGVELIITSKDMQSADVLSSNENGTIFKFLNSGVDLYDDSDLVCAGTKFNRNIKNWVVLRGSGVPFYTEPYKYRLNGHLLDDTTGIKLITFTDAKVYPGDELLYLRAERMFAADPRTSDKDTLRNFNIQKIEKSGSDWAKANPFETGILEIYMELDTNPGENILTLYVLSTGGTDDREHERPADWPKEHARWDDEYKKDVMYVSKASWKLNNLAENFTWN